MDETKNKLQEEIERVLEILSRLSPDTEEYKVASDSLVKLYNLQNSEKKIELDFQEKEARRELEERCHTDEVDANYQIRKDDFEEKRNQRKIQIIELLVGVGVTAATFVGNLAFHNHWLKETYKFEETGSLSGGASRGVVNSIFGIFKTYKK